MSTFGHSDALRKLTKQYQPARPNVTVEVAIGADRGGLKAVLPDADGRLTAGELHLMSELLDRLTEPVDG